jgi:hypothetical protein
MKNFSMFEQAIKLTHSSGVDDLGDVSYISRQIFDANTTFRFASSFAGTRHRARRDSH